MKFHTLILSALIFAAPITLTTGCQTYGDVEHVVGTYKTADAVITSVDLAMRGWADYVVAEKRRIRELPEDKAGPAGLELLKREGRVFNAYATYQKSVLAAREVVDLAVENRDPLPKNVEAAATALLSLIQTIK